MVVWRACECVFGVDLSSGLFAVWSFYFSPFLSSILLHDTLPASGLDGGIVDSLARLFGFSIFQTQAFILFFDWLSQYPVIAIDAIRLRIGLPRYAYSDARTLPIVSY